MRFTTFVLVLSTIVATAHVSAVATGSPSYSGGGRHSGGSGGGSGGDGNGFSKRHLVVPDSNLHNFLRRPAGIVDQRLKAIWNSYRQEQQEPNTATATERSMQRKAVHDAVAEFRAQLIQQVQDFVDARAITARDISQDIKDLVTQYVDTSLETLLLSNLADSEVEEQTVHHRHATEAGLRARVSIWLDGLGRTLFAQVWETLAQRDLVKLRSRVDHDCGDHNDKSKIEYDHVEDRVLSVYKV
ncbi:hypothetical protein BGZ82_009392 [Podila clonocystis]|nr:hypothetical protein BGZ82_009392 [Podila clonocystis]